MSFKMTWVNYNCKNFTSIHFAETREEAEKIKKNLETMRHVSEVKIEEITNDPQP